MKEARVLYLAVDHRFVLIDNDCIEEGASCDALGHTRWNKTRETQAHTIYKLLERALDYHDALCDLTTYIQRLVACGMLSEEKFNSTLLSQCEDLLAKPQEVQHE